MQGKKFRIRPEINNQYQEIYYPETRADLVIETEDKVIMTMEERNKLSTIGYNANEYIHPTGMNEDGSNPHDITLTMLGLEKVDNVKQLPIAGGTMAGQLRAVNNTSYTTAQVRNITLSTANPSGGGHGDIWIKYK